jgi:hypothetical protein
MSNNSKRREFFRRHLSNLPEPGKVPRHGRDQQKNISF